MQYDQTDEAQTVVGLDVVVQTALDLDLVVKIVDCGPGPAQSGRVDWVIDLIVVVVVVDDLDAAVVAAVVAGQIVLT